MKKRFSAKAHISVRYMILAIAFGVLCLAFVGVLAYFQIRGSTLPPKEEGYTRTYTVPGLRGEIYDCNGKLLAGNSTSYDLIFEYGAMSDTRREVNLALLTVMEATLKTGNGDKLCKSCRCFATSNR